MGLAPLVRTTHVLALVGLFLAGCSGAGQHAARLASSGKKVASFAFTQPDPRFTPGSLCTTDDPYFDGLRYPEQVAHCKRHVTMAMKREIARNYGVDEADFSDYEFDHYLPLGIGGGTDVANLWPQPIDEAKDKDKLENELYKELAAGDITQADAVAQTRAWGG